MKPHKILSQTSHRPWPLPPEKWQYYQEWNQALFLHWQVDFDALRKLVPYALALDLFDGNPWVSIVIFKMEKMRVRNLPSFSPISNFDEINIRTYVTYDGKPGVYFLSIEAGNRLSCSIARKLAGLPYRYSLVERNDHSCISKNSKFNDKLVLNYRVGNGPIAKDALDLWLTERYALFQDSFNVMNAFDIHHVEWPVVNVELLALQVVYPRFDKLLNGSPDLVHFSPGVQVLAWGKKQSANGRVPK